MKLYMKLILVILGLLMTTANYAQRVVGTGAIDASEINGDRGHHPPKTIYVDGTNDAEGSDDPSINLAHWLNALSIGKVIDIDNSDSFSDNWLDAADECSNRGMRLPTVADFWLVSIMKKELEEDPYFTPFRRGKAKQIPSNSGDQGWHYWLATEIRGMGEYSYMMVFDDDGDELTDNIRLGDSSSKAGIRRIISDPPIWMPFRCVSDF